MEEIWKDIPGYEGLYQVSNLGRVYSLPKFNHKGLYMSFGKTMNNYYFVYLYRNNKSKSFRIHQLVAMAFLNHKINGNKLVVDHINNDKSDNRAENLQIVTQRHNTSKDKNNCSSKYVGVSWNKAAKKWKVAIRDKDKRIHLGYYTDELEASKAYQEELKRIINETNR
jgi:hypothetical protein